MLQALIDGILLGGVYGVIATGLSLVFGVLGVVNFAQAEFLMLGMYVAWFAWRYLGLDPLLGSVLSFIVVFGIGYLVQRLLIARVLKAPPAAQVFLTVGLLIVLENAALMLFGSDFRSVSVPYQVQGFR
ncbi:MAG: branched-chain amino acid ABC transporter permease, partial [Rhizobiales bacterium 24-66-13]